MSENQNQTPVVRCRDVSRTYAKKMPYRSMPCARWTLDVHAGEVVSLAGPSGSGKSTSARTSLAVLDEFDGGFRCKWTGWS